MQRLHGMGISDGENNRNDLKRRVYQANVVR